MEDKVIKTIYHINTATDNVHYGDDYVLGSGSNEYFIPGKNIQYFLNNLFGSEINIHLQETIDNTSGFSDNSIVSLPTRFFKECSKESLDNYLQKFSEPW